MIGLGATLRSAIRSILVSLFLVSAIGIGLANATLRMGGKGLVCIEAFELAADWNMRARTDLADRVSGALQAKLAELKLVGSVRAQPNCIKPDQPGFDRQLRMILSIKKQTIKIDSRDWSVAIAGGVSPDGLFQDRELQPIVIVQQDSVFDERIVEALNEFVEHTIVAALRR
jgi:hypothetical protein